MNALLEKALAEQARLSEAEQEAIATLILDEIGAERGWEERFAKTEDQLGALVRLARAKWRGVTRCPAIPPTRRSEFMERVYSSFH